MGRPKNARKEEPYKSGSWATVHVQCPFFKGDTQQAIACEGLEDREKLRRLMPSEEKKRSIMLRFCCDRYRECEIYRLVAAKYDE